MEQWNKTVRTEQDREIPGRTLAAFIFDGDMYFPTDVNVYKDGMIECLGIVKFEQFKEYIAQRRIVTSLPENAEVRIGFLAKFTAKNVHSWIKEEEFLKEITDVIHELNGEQTSFEKCGDAYKNFQETPCLDSKKALREAYESIPEHNRKYLGDMDSKDRPIKKIIYGG